MTYTVVLFIIYALPELARGDISIGDLAPPKAIVLSKDEKPGDFLAAMKLLLLRLLFYCDEPPCALKRASSLICSCSY